MPDEYKRGWKLMAFDIEGQVANRVVIRTFLATCNQGVLMQKTNTSQYMYLRYVYMPT
jgi:hypothetical protein